MKIKNPECFKTWLAAVLGPKCETEPKAFAKYIVGLLKFIPSINELQKFLLPRLEEFLNNKTEVFIALIIETLQNESYLKEDLVQKKTENEIKNSGEKSVTGEKPIDNVLKEEEKPTKKSCSFVRSKSINKDNCTKRYWSYDYSDVENKEGDLHCKNRYHDPSWLSKRPDSIELNRRFPNHSQVKYISSNKQPREDILAEFRKSENNKNNTLGRYVDLEKRNCTKSNLCVYDPLIPSVSSSGEEHKLFKEKREGLVDGIHTVESQDCFKRKNLDIEDNNYSNKKSKVDYRRLSPKASSKTFYLDNGIANTSPLAIKKDTEIIKLSLIKEQKEAKKLVEGSSVSTSITKRKQKLLDDGLHELNKLIKAVPSVKCEEKQMWMDTISRLKKNIENIKADLASTIKKPRLELSNINYDDL